MKEALRVLVIVRLQGIEGIGVGNVAADTHNHIAPAA